MAPIVIKVVAKTARVEAQPVQPVAITPGDGARVVVVAKPGPPGPAGSDGAEEYLHTQSAPSSSWLVEHGLNKPIVAATVYSSDLSTQYDGVFVEPLDDNTCRLWMSPALSGRARIF